MMVGVVEWASDSLRFPSVILAEDVAGVLREVGRECQGFTFDDGGLIDAHRDTFREDMSLDELRAWYAELWEETTDCALTVYSAPDLFSAPMVLTDDDAANWR